MLDLGGWLRSLGLERYEAAFRENEIDETVLPRLKPWFNRPARPVRIDLRHSGSRRWRERCPPAPRGASLISMTMKIISGRPAGRPTASLGVGLAHFPSVSRG